MANPPEKGSFLGRLLKIFKNNPDIKPPGTPVESETSKHRGTKEEKKEIVHARAEELRKLLERVTPSHKAIEVLQGVKFSDSALANPKIKELLLDVLYRSDKDVYGVHAYHQRDWLENTLKRINEIEGSINPLDVETLESMKKNIIKLNDQAVDTDQRESARREQLAGAVTGNPVSSVQTFRQAVEKLKEEDTPEGREVLRVVDQYQGDPKSPDDFANISGIINKQMADMVQKLDQTKTEEVDKFTKRYNNMQRANEKLAKLFIEKFPQEGRFYRMGPDQLKNLEKAMHESPQLMDYYFYKILEPILYNEHLESHRELYNLYTQGDMEAFLEIVLHKRDAQGRNVGKDLVSYYTTLKNTILQSHDMDYYAAHPVQDMKEFITSTAMFTNQFINFAHQDPMTALAKRAYEVALLQIREDHNGYIPREYLSWDRGRMVSKLDARVEKIVKDAIRNGQLYHEKIDPVTGKPDPNRFGRVRADDNPYTLDELYGGQPPQSDDWRRQLGDLKLSAALKQAKGLALVDMRLLEIIARSKGAGSDMEMTKDGNYAFGPNEAFNSVPYENIVRHIEPIIHHFSRWKIAREEYLPFFSMMITGKDHTWSAEKIHRLIELHLDGDHERMRKEFGDDIDTRLLATDNPFSFSGMWGTMTGWRIADGTVGWDDWEREKYSTANKLMTVGDRFIRQGDHYHHEKPGEEHNVNYAAGRANKKVGDYFMYSDDKYKGADGKTARQLTDAFKEQYRESLRNSRDFDLMRIAASDEEFELKWETSGLNQKEPKSGKSYKALLGAHLDSIRKNPHVEMEIKELEMKLERAYRARIWVQAAMRSPLIVAREWKAKYKIAGYDREGPIRKKIIYDLLGIDIDEINRIGSPTVEEIAILDRVTDLEAAVFSVQQTALKENRDLEDADFDVLRTRAKTPEEIQIAAYARDYWKSVQNYMLGDHKTAQKWYEKIGIEDADKNKLEGLRSHKINWHNIHAISLDKHKSSIFENPEGFTSKLMTSKTIDRDWRYLFSTEDMAWEYINMGAYGDRNPIRRAGDLGAHYGFNNKFEELLVNVLSGHLDKEAFIKVMREMWNAMSGDAGDPATDACSRVFYTTLQMYRKFDKYWKIPLVGPVLGIVQPGSVMQTIFGNLHADAFGPNKLLELVQMGEAARIFPPHVKSNLTGKMKGSYPVYAGMPKPNWDAHKMEVLLQATPQDAIYEMITMGVLIAIAITIWRAVTAKDEESEGGGGGGGSGH